jgi:hypothetical protein
MLVGLVHFQLFKAGKGQVALVALPLVGLGIAVRVEKPLPHLVHLCKVVVQYGVVIYPVLYATHYADVNSRDNNLKEQRWHLIELSSIRWQAAFTPAFQR